MRAYVSVHLQIESEAILQSHSSSWTCFVSSSHVPADIFGNQSAHCQERRDSDAHLEER